MRVNTVLYQELIEKIDAAAKEQGLSRSGFIREASERYLAELARKKAESASPISFPNISAPRLLTLSNSEHS